MENIQNVTVSSTVIDGGQSRTGTCSRNIVYRERLVKNVDIVYTDVFLDVTNYLRDKGLFIKQILGFSQWGPSNESTDSDGSETLEGEKRTNVVIVCSTALYDYISGAEQASGRELSNGLLAQSGNANIFICDMSMEVGPERVDSLVTFNIDPFEACSSVGNQNNQSEFRRTFKRFVSADAPESDNEAVAVCMVFSMFLLNERALETFIAVNNVGIAPSDIRFVFVHDNTDVKAVREVVCNYCTDIMLCLNSDMQSFVVDGDMPSSIDFALAVNPLYLIILKTRLDTLRASPENEYFRFKQFYHTFAYGKQCKWGLDVEGGNDPATGRSFYIQSLNDILQLELVRLFKILRRTARHKFEKDLKRRSPHLNVQPNFPSYGVGSEMMDYEESGEMIEAREKLFKAYYSCPILMDTVDIRSITMLGNNEGRTLLKRDQRRLLASLKNKENPDHGTALYSLEPQTNLYDTMTYPIGGNISDSNVLDVLFAEEIGVSGCFVAGKNHQIRYNRFLLDMLYVQQGGE